jgi:hypothetical protein
VKIKGNECGRAKVTHCIRLYCLMPIKISNIGKEGTLDTKKPYSIFYSAGKHTETILEPGRDQLRMTCSMKSPVTLLLIPMVQMSPIPDIAVPGPGSSGEERGEWGFEGGIHPVESLMVDCIEETILKPDKGSRPESPPFVLDFGEDISTSSRFFDCSTRFCVCTVLCIIARGCPHGNQNEKTGLL